MSTSRSMHARVATVTWLLLCVAHIARGVAATKPVIELFLLPHTHADVGWLETPENLARVNVSRILDGVVGNLGNDTLKRRRFVWDEMYFLQWWWENRATSEQQAMFNTLVQEGRIEFVDNGWSQHDMGCTTYDSMMNNWLEGHLWIKEKFGAAVRPRVGWSLDPFGLSTTQAVLQSLMGFDAWFFTRVSSFVVDEGKKDKSLEFIWRASSSLPDQQTEIFTHIFESYYCMPLPTYAFEWGPGKGAKPPTTANIEKLARGLALIAEQRAPWFRSNNVLIPWGCDYQFQNADLMYNATDWLIDTINAHPEWGVHVQYTTAREYLAAMQSANVALPVKDDKQTFFPFNTWSGYFTSRPKLKTLSQQAHGPLHAAEGLYALRTPKQPEQRQKLWDLLETARRNAGVVQHHDAITGTPCSSQEGCSGVDQVMGAHNVLQVYEDMVIVTAENSNLVIAQILQEQSGLELSPHIEDFGNTLMDQHPITIVVYNSLATRRTDIVSMQVPICNVAVADANGTTLLSQVTAQFTINDGVKPFYDFDLHFEATLAPLSYTTFTVTPMDGDAHCGGGDMALQGAKSTFRQHVPVWPPAATAPASALDGLIDSVIRDQQEMVGGGSPMERAAHQAPTGMPQDDSPPPPPPTDVLMENAFLRVYVNTKFGLQAVFDKGTGKNYSFTHQLMEYQSSVNDAYDFKPKGPASPVGAAGACPGSGSGAAAAGACFKATCGLLAATSPCAFTMLGAKTCKAPARCKGWVQTAHCDMMGARQPENTKSCTDRIDATTSGFCECEGKAYPFACDLTRKRASFTCAGVCGAVATSRPGQEEGNGTYAPVPLLATTISLGPVMQEVRFQVSTEHKTRVRLWVSDDPAVGGRIELGHRIGVLEQQTEVASRFTVQELQNAAFFSEDNGYETVRHSSGSGAENINLNHYPSQMSTFISDGVDQLSVALEHGHGVASLYNGTLDVMQHRRGGPFVNGHGTVVLDDSDRIFTETWVSLGNVSTSNRLRHSNKLRLNHPLTVMFAKGGQTAPKAKFVDPLASLQAMPGSVHLQNARATSVSADEVLLSLLHVYGAKEAPAAASQPQSIDLAALIRPFRPTLTHINETTLNGMIPRAALKRLQWNTTTPSRGTSLSPAAASVRADVINPFEFRTFLAKGFGFA